MCSIMVILSTTYSGELFFVWCLRSSLYICVCAFEKQYVPPRGPGCVFTDVFIIHNRHIKALRSTSAHIDQDIPQATEGKIRPFELVSVIPLGKLLPLTKHFRSDNGCCAYCMCRNTSAYGATKLINVQCVTGGCPFHRSVNAAHAFPFRVTVKKSLPSHWRLCPQ